jgi:hypothetical protein
MPSARNRGKMRKHARKAHSGIYRAIWHLEHGNTRRALEILDGTDEHSVEFHVARVRERLSGESKYD